MFFCSLFEMLNLTLQTDVDRCTQRTKKRNGQQNWGNGNKTLADALKAAV